MSRGVILYTYFLLYLHSPFVHSMWMYLVSSSWFVYASFDMLFECFAYHIHGASQDERFSVASFYYFVRKKFVLSFLLGSSAAKKMNVNDNLCLCAAACDQK